MMPCFGALRWRLNGMGSLTLVPVDLRTVLRLLAEDLGVPLLPFEVGAFSLDTERCFLRITGSS